MRQALRPAAEAQAATEVQKGGGKRGRKADVKLSKGTKRERVECVRRRDEMTLRRRLE